MVPIFAKNGVLPDTAVCSIGSRLTFAKASSPLSDIFYGQSSRTEIDRLSKFPGGPGTKFFTKKLWQKSLKYPLQTYSCLPYGNTVYHLSATLHAMANPLMAFFAFFVPCRKMKWYANTTTT